MKATVTLTFKNVRSQTFTGANLGLSSSSWATVVEFRHDGGIASYPVADVAAWRFSVEKVAA